MQLIKITAFVFLGTATIHTFADRPGLRHDVGGGGRTYQVRQNLLDRIDGRHDQQIARDSERRREREFVQPDSSGSGMQPQVPIDQVPDTFRRQGKLTPEERRALRRQIDEVGHDIYAPKR